MIYVSFRIFAIRQPFVSLRGNQLLTIAYSLLPYYKPCTLGGRLAGGKKPKRDELPALN
ncbi:MAG: hypothetical protein WCP52_07085 [Bacteroidota bacterium]